MSDVIIHIDEQLGTNAIHSIEYTVSQLDGVTSACVHENTRHLMVVDYDGKNISSGQLLNCVQSQGLHAELIGL